MNTPKISIVIPCHNEENAILPVMEKIRVVRAQMPNIHEVIVVDDGSTDTSSLILQRLEDITVLRSEVAGGYGAALKKGFSHASGDLILFLDMDDTYDIRDLPQMLQLFMTKNLDVVFGNRLADTNGMPWIRWFGNNFYHYCLKALGFPHIQDPCTGMRLFRSSLKADFCQPQENDLSYSMALTLKILRTKLAFAEVRIAYHERIGESKLNPLIDGGRFFWTILVNRLSA